jgi:hypothetical protein
LISLSRHIAWHGLDFCAVQGQAQYTLRANTGGVIVSYLEWSQKLSNDRWKEEKAWSGWGRFNHSLAKLLSPTCPNSDLKRTFVLSADRRYVDNCIYRDRI